MILSCLEGLGSRRPSLTKQGCISTITANLAANSEVSLANAADRAAHWRSDFLPFQGTRPSSFDHEGPCYLGTRTEDDARGSGHSCSACPQESPEDVPSRLSRSERKEVQES